MNKENVIQSLDALKDLAERIGRSQDPGYRMSLVTVKRWELDMKIHLTLICRELGLDEKVIKPAEPARTVVTEEERPMNQQY